MKERKVAKGLSADLCVLRTRIPGTLRTRRSTDKPLSLLFFPIMFFMRNNDHCTLRVIHIRIKYV